MRIIGHGIDIERIQRIRNEIDSGTNSWVNCFCSIDEREAADPPPAHYRYYAGRYAAKEAIAKALGTGFSGKITWHGIEILRGKNGAPYVRLNHDVAKFSDELGILDWHVSISYSSGIAFASAIATGE